MTANGPVLRDIHLPPAAWWPLAPGWWMLLALVVLSAVFGAWWCMRRARRRPRVAALREVDALAAAFARDGDAGRLADGASRLLRRVARSIDPAAAARDGEAWRAFLHAHARGAAEREALDGLVDARFRAQPRLDAPALLATLRAWCRSALADGGARKVSRKATGGAGSEVAST